MFDGQRTGFLTRNIIIMIVVGLTLRYALGFFMTYNYDVHSWALIMENIESGNGLYDLAGYNYAPPWGYVLGSISTLAGFLGVDVYGIMSTPAISLEDYTNWFFTSYITSIEFNMMVKSVLFVFDLLAGYLIWWIVSERSGDRHRSEMAFGLWFLCPFVIAVSSVGGMFDALSALMTMMCIVFVMRDRNILAGMMLGIATLMKLFPGMLLFVLVAYIFVKNKDRKIAIRKTALSAAGVLISLSILLLPQVISGDLSSCFAFLTSRATDNIGSGLGDIERYGTVAAYVAIILVSVLLGICFLRREHEDPDGKLLVYILINLAVVFLYPATPQYMLLITPFLIMQMVLMDKRFRVPYLILCVGTTMFALSGNAVDLMSLAEFSNIIDTDTVLWAIDVFQTKFLGVNGMEVLYYGGGVVQYIGTIAIFVTFHRIHKDADPTRALSTMN